MSRIPNPSCRRRRLVWILAVLLTLCHRANGQGNPEATRRFEVTEATIQELQAAMQTGRTTSLKLVQAYLERIRAYDPLLNSMISINDGAPAEAERLDRERAAKGPRGPLHGIPVVLKDNYDTADLPTTAGSVALAGFRPPDDAFQVRKLREAGCVIIGKANMHELACGITTISSLGGQTRNPYDLSRNPGGSSGGTGAAVAANFASFGMGSDTCGSIRIPASHNCLAGLRPTHGLASLDGIIPLSHTQDVGGPLARTIADLALVLDVTAGEDPSDPATRPPGGRPKLGFAASLDPGALRGARIGILNVLFGDAPEDEEVGRIIRAAVKEFERLGAATVEAAIPELTRMLEGSSVIDYEFKFDLADYLAGIPGAPVKSLGEILDGGLYHAMLERTFRRRNAAVSRDSKEYGDATARRKQIQEVVLKLMDGERLDALAYPTMRRKPAPLSEPQRGTTCQLSASTGFPALSFPAGFMDDGLPVGIELLGRPWSDPKLLAFGYAYEQATHQRRAPARMPPLIDGREPLPAAWEAELSGGETIPAVSTPASGRVRFSFDPVQQTLGYTIELSGIQEKDILSVGIHRAARGENGPVVRLLSSRPLRNLAGSAELGNSDRQDLLAGKLYLSVSTARYRAGELRAQLAAPGPQP